MRRATSVLTALVAVVGLIFVGTSAQAATVHKYPLVGPAADFWCEGLQPVEWEDSSEQIDGFATFTADPKKQEVSVLLSVRGLEPNHDYLIRFSQFKSVTFPQCRLREYTLRTNAAGNGNIKWTDSIFGTRAQFLVITNLGSSDPTYRAANFFTIPSA